MVARKKRGVKPGTKRGKYRKHKTLRIKVPKDFILSNEPLMSPTSKAMSLYAQLDDALATLEARMAGTIRRINSILEV